MYISYNKLLYIPLLLVHHHVLLCLLGLVVPKKVKKRDSAPYVVIAISSH